MKKVFLSSLLCSCFLVISVVLWTGKASAQPFPGGLPQCEASLESCNADLDACEAQPAAAVPQTGQTRCWGGTPLSIIPCADTGQDGDIKAGVVPPVPRFTDNGDGTITDNLTGLIWLKDADCLRGIRTWQQALDFANSLADPQCGLTDDSIAGDWYLPNRNQLTSLLDLENFNPALPTGHPFMNFQLYHYWSSTNHAVNLFSAWIVMISNGNIFLNDKTAGSFVTAVRGGS